MLYTFSSTTTPIPKPATQEAIPTGGEGDTPSDWSDDKLLEKARNAKSGSKFISLFDHGDISTYGDDASSADLALCGMLAFWTGKDANRMDGLFRLSQLYRNEGRAEKWDKKHYSDGRTYGQGTIDKALEGCSTTYDPNYNSESNTKPSNSELSFSNGFKAGNVGSTAIIKRGDEGLNECLELVQKVSKGYGDLDKIFELAFNANLGKKDLSKLFAELTSPTGLTIPSLRKYYVEKALLISNKNSPFVVKDGVWCNTVISKQTGEKAVVPLCNFDAWITRSITCHNGDEKTLYFELEGNFQGKPLESLEVLAEDYAGMKWVSKWGPNVSVQPGRNTLDFLRAAIQTTANYIDHPVTEIYDHTGWRKIDGNWCFLHGGGAIGKEDVTVELNGSLKDYILPVLPEKSERDEAYAEKLKEGIRASLDILKVAPLEVTVPFLCAAYRAPLNEFLPADFSLFLEGLTGSKKSCITSLAQAHFGAGFNYDKHPGSWRSTANSLEKSLGSAKDVPFTIDDFNPTGTANEISRHHSNAESIFRTVGNRSSRGRLNRDATQKESIPPRGLVVSSGEDQPKGHSLRARLFITRLTHGDVSEANLTKSQKHAADGTFAFIMANFIDWLFDHLDDLEESLAAKLIILRDSFKFSHGRTNTQVAHLLIGLEFLLQFALDKGVLSEEEAKELYIQCKATLVVVAEKQTTYQQESNPQAAFLETLASMLSTGKTHLRSANNPDKPDYDDLHLARGFGWTMNLRSPEQELEPQGEHIGWFKREGDRVLVYLDKNKAYACVNKALKDSNTSLPTTVNTLFRQLKETGKLLHCEKDRTDSKRIIAGYDKKLRVTIIDSETIFPTKEEN